MAQPNTKISSAVDGRNMARLAAVQALYQMEHSSAGVEVVIREFEEHRLGGELEGEAIRDADSDHFQTLVRGVVSAQNKIDPFINKLLSKGWALKRLDATARAILRCGAYELVNLPDIPYKAIIDQYVEITSSFFDQDSEESGFVNALLDSAAKEVRADEIG